MGDEVKVLKDDMSTWWNKLPKQVRDVVLVSTGVLVGIGLNRAAGALSDQEEFEPISPLDSSKKRARKRRAAERAKKQQVKKRAAKRGP